MSECNPALPTLEVSDAATHLHIFERRECEWRAQSIVASEGGVGVGFAAAYDGAQNRVYLYVGPPADRHYDNSPPLTQAQLVDLIVFLQRVRAGVAQMQYPEAP